MNVTVTSKKEVRRGHCWHVTMAAGTENHMRCCQCGMYGRQRWTQKHDPAHGPYVDIKLWYQDPVVTEGADPDAPCVRPTVVATVNSADVDTSRNTILP